MGRVNQMPSISKYAPEPILKETIIKDHYVVKKDANEKAKALIKELPKVGETDGWFPTMQQAEELTSNLPENYSFLLWLITSNEEVSETDSHKSVSDYIYKTLRERVYVA